MRQIAEARKVPILQRFAIMKYLVTSAQYTPQQLLAPDLFHPNDFTYGCLGRFLADALQDEVGRSKAVKLRRARACQGSRRRGGQSGALVGLAIEPISTPVRRRRTFAAGLADARTSMRKDHA